jgi:hypothetical protein
VFRVLGLGAQTGGDELGAQYAGLRNTQYAGLNGVASERGDKKAVPSSSCGRYLCSGAPSARGRTGEGEGRGGYGVRIATRVRGL